VALSHASLFLTYSSIVALGMGVPSFANSPPFSHIESGVSSVLVKIALAKSIDTSARRSKETPLEAVSLERTDDDRGFQTTGLRGRTTHEPQVPQKFRLHVLPLSAFWVKTFGVPLSFSAVVGRGMFTAKLCTYKCRVSWGLGGVWYAFEAKRTAIH
jgi:hypothetical protein